MSELFGNFFKIIDTEFAKTIYAIQNYSDFVYSIHSYIYQYMHVYE